MQYRTRNNPKHFSRILASLILSVLLSGCMVNNGVIPENVETLPSETEAPATSSAPVPSSVTEAPTTTEAPTATEAPTTVTEAPTAPPPFRLTITAVGDMLMHPDVSGLAFQPDGSVNYDFIFAPVYEEIRNADIAVVNNEVPFGGNEYGLKNYPAFNVFTELGDAEAKAGFDIITLATNHVRDMGTNGILRTMEFWKKYPEIMTVGVHESQADYNSLHIITVKGVRIAIFNYVYGVNAGVDPERPYLIDLMTPPYEEKIKAEIQRAEREADFTIVFPHWGEEYRLTQTAGQAAWATAFTEWGADLIIGTHPHCVEPVKRVTSPNGNSSICFYSLGNYISMQDETISMLEALAKITLLVENGKPRIVNYEMQPLVAHYDQTIKWCYNVRLENYTQALVNQHAIKVCGFPGDGAVKGSRLNDRYPFSLETLHALWNQMIANSDW